MIYSVNKEKDNFIEAELEIRILNGFLLEVHDTFFRKYLVHFDGPTESREHGPRFKFKNFDTPISIAMDRNDYHINIEVSKFSHARKSDVHEAVDVSCMLAEFLGAEYAAYFKNATESTKAALVNKIYQFKLLDNDTLNRLLKSGKQRVTGRLK